MTVILVLTIAFATILNNIIRGSGVKVEGFDDPKKGTDTSKSVGKESIQTNPVAEATSKPVATATTTPAKSASPSPKVLMENLKDQALELQAAQENIISGFQQIEPHMQRAENLIGSIQETAQTIQGMKTNPAAK